MRWLKWKFLWEADTLLLQRLILAEKYEYGSTVTAVSIADNLKNIQNLSGTSICFVKKKRNCNFHQRGPGGI